MKYLFLLLLCCNIVLGQKKYPDRIKVTAYRLVDEYDDSPCSIISYFEEGTIGYYIRGVESYDSKFAYRLIELKEEAQKKWKKKDLWCSDRCIGCETIPNMFIIEINAYRDTIYTTRDNASIFIPSKQKEYLDPKNKLSTAFPKEIAELFKEDFYDEMYFPILDSIASDNVLLNNKLLYRMTRKSFETSVSKFDIIETDSMLFAYNKRIDKVFHAQMATVQFKNNDQELIKIEYANPKDNYYNQITLSVDGIVTGTTEAFLKNRLPNSTQYKRYDVLRFSLDDLKDNYFYEVKLTNKRGWVHFYMQNGIINKIEIDFYYPD